MRYRTRVTGHLLERMRERNVSQADIEAALANQISTWRTPKNSTCIIGRVGDRQLKIWVVETLPSDEVTIKSVAWKDA